MKNASLITFLAGISLMACTPSADPNTTPTPGPEAAAPVEPAPPSTVEPTTPPEDACGATQHAALIGKPITEAGVPAEGPNVRYIRPNTQVTMDFRADRLNIDIDAAEVITGFRCT